MTTNLPFVRRSIPLGTRSWLIDTVDDELALLSHAETSAQFPFGLMLWESAIALAQLLTANPTLAANKSVLELGAGLGLTGVVAASLGATVTQTDHDEAALASCARTAALNGITTITRHPGDWHTWTDPNRYDLILGADITYDGDDHTALLTVFDRALAPTGTILLADPCRENLSPFIALARTANWTITQTKATVADLKIPAKVRPITLLNLQRLT
ncbi:MAG: methyltransferase domain-containing protein [Hyphomicrobiaceae bacterium]